ncbi:hypothetical protein HY734_03335 [Candidatus Uhrbacteria bacterium]|nr:hypothetical protein [Candidatus Uhrbacteria bacterium]
MEILPLSKRLHAFLRNHRLEQTFRKQTALFCENPWHPSLHTEVLEPKRLRIYSFRLTRSYRVMFVYCGSETIEIIDVNNHYR